jgi:AcrR family transcriptional regulator
VPDDQRPATQPRGVARRAAILDAAEATFAELGYERATMRDIAGRAGASLSSVYHFFDGKESLARALAVRYVERIVETAREAAEPRHRDESLTTIVRRLISAQATFLDRSPALVAIHDAVEQMEGGAALAAAMEDNLVGQVDALLAAHARHLPARQRQPVGTLIVTTVHAVLERSAGMPAAARAALLDALETALVRYLAPYE